MSNYKIEHVCAS